MHASGRPTVRRTQVDGAFAVHTWTDQRCYRSNAYLVVPKVDGGWHYVVRASGFSDRAYYGCALTLGFAVEEAAAWSAGNGSLDRVQDRGTAWWVWLSSISGPIERADEVGPYFDARFAGMQVAVDVEFRTPGPPG